jgi:cytochrome b involved in lipid metabolism
VLFVLSTALYHTTYSPTFSTCASDECLGVPAPSHTRFSIRPQAQGVQHKMAESKEFTYSDVAEHNTKKDLFIVVHDKVYNASSFVDEHP